MSFVCSLRICFEVKVQLSCEIHSILFENTDGGTLHYISFSHDQYRDVYSTLLRWSATLTLQHFWSSDKTIAYCVKCLRFFKTTPSNRTHTQCLEHGNFDMTSQTIRSLSTKPQLTAKQYFENIYMTHKQNANWNFTHLYVFVCTILALTVLGVINSLSSQ